MGLDAMVITNLFCARSADQGVSACCPDLQAKSMKHLFLALVLLALVPAHTAHGQKADLVANPYEISKEDFFVEGSAPVRKSGAYDVTIVYFMDYQCPACRQYTPDVARVLQEDKRLRVIYRDTPLLGPRSEAAARAAIASHFQGRHEAFHHALMTTKGPLDEPAIRAAADKAKVDWSRLQRDLAARSDEIDEVIVRNLELAAATGIQGTPAFIVGESQSNGALDYALLRAEIADARKAATNGAPLVNSDELEQANLDRPKAEAGIERNGVEAPGAAHSPLFIPAKPTVADAVQSTNGSPRHVGLGIWLVAILVGSAGSAALWKFSRGRFRANGQMK